MKFLLIDNDTELLRAIKKRLEDAHDHLEIVLAFSIRSGLKLLSADEYSLVLIRLSSEDKSVYDLLPLIRNTMPIPICIVSQFSGKEMVKAYILGADFCLSEPQSPDALEAFLNAQYRRIAQLSHIQYHVNVPMIIHKDLIIYPLSRTVSRHGQEIALSYKEFELLYFLARNVGRVMTQELIFEHVFHSDISFNSNIGSRIARLRKKIEPNPQAPTYIKTIRGAGYMLLSN